MAGPRVGCLLYSPGLLGHREVYVRVLASIAAGRGLSVALAADLREAGSLATPLLEDLEPVLGGRIIDLSGAPGGGADVGARDLRRLVQRVGAGVTVLTEADDHLPALASLALPGVRRVPGRLVGIFLRSTNYIYEPDPAGGLRRRLGRLRRWRTDARLFHDVLQPRRRPLTTALCLDERFVREHRAGHAWLPDISTAFEIERQDAQDGSEVRRWRSRLREFLAANVGRPLLVYLGTPQRRRGYDRVLRLAVAVEGCVAQCGRPPDGHDRGPERAALADAGRLLETGGPYSSAATAALFVDAARCVVLPYREHLGSSGVMLQTLAAGRPVLVPDRGLMAWRTRVFGLGRTWDADDETALPAAFERLQAEGPGPYADAIDRYMRCFRQAQVEAAVVAALGFGGAGAALPVESEGADR